MTSVTDRADLDAFLEVRRRLPSPAQRRLMDDYVAIFDVTGPDRAARLIYSQPDDPIGALKADLAAFRAERAAELTAAEAEAHDRRREQRRGFRPGSVEYELARVLTKDEPA